MMIASINIKCGTYPYLSYKICVCALCHTGLIINTIIRQYDCDKIKENEILHNHMESPECHTECSVSLLNLTHCSYLYLYLTHCDPI